MSGDVSPHGNAVRRPALSEPSLARVVATTLRLWWRRRVLRVADGAPIGAARWVLVILVVLAVAAVGVWAGVTPSHPAAPRREVAPRPNPVTLQTAANENLAAAWIVAQLAPGLLVGCDPVMCARLQSAGLPATQDAVLLAGAALPAGAVVVATPALRETLAAQLASRSAQTLASFGAGREQIQVLVTAATTTAAFLTMARHAFAASASTGRALARNGRLHMSASLRHVLTSGQVDIRLLVLLQRLLAAHSVSVAAFGDAGPGASSSVQLRSVTIYGLVQGTGKHKFSDLYGVLKLLRSQRAPYRASVQEVPAAGGGVALVIQVPAPSPL